jgi:hypothetical protein
LQLAACSLQLAACSLQRKRIEKIGKKFEVLTEITDFPLFYKGLRGVKK